MKSEKQIQDEIRLSLSEHGLVFRTNAGDFWQGTRVYSKEFNQPILINLRRVQGLPTGFSDLLFLGDGYAAFIETKRQGEKAKPEQENFIERVRQLKHCAGIARSVEDALEIIGESGKSGCL